MARVKAYSYTRKGVRVFVRAHNRRSGGSVKKWGLDYTGQPFDRPALKTRNRKVRISPKRMLDDPTFDYNLIGGTSKLKHSGGRRRGPTSLGNVISRSKTSVRKSKMDLSQAAPDYSDMAVSDIAREIEKEWSGQKGGVNFAARPYLNAMRSLNSFEEHYGLDPGRSIGHYFLSNASQFRGPKAKALKAELRKRLNTPPRSR